MPGRRVTFVPVSTHAGAAATTLRALLSQGSRRGQVVGVHPTCAYVLVGAELLALETADGLGLPCAVRLGLDRSAGPLAAVRRGDEATVGPGSLTVGPVSVRVTRWWAPRLPRTGDPATRIAPMAELLAGLSARIPVPVPVEAPPEDLVGLGPGLTPAGDDVLAGLLLGLHHHPRLRDPVAARVAALAPTRTTALSAALLRHAAEGHSFPAAVHVADALTGHRPDLDGDVARLVAVGHTSGAALAHGLLHAARTVTAQRQEATA